MAAPDFGLTKSVRGAAPAFGRVPDGVLLCTLFCAFVCGTGFGLGTGTVAEGWIYDAVNFWEEQFSGDIPTKRVPANLQNWLLTKAKVIDDGFTVAANRVTSAEDDVTAWAEKHELN